MKITLRLGWDKVEEDDASQLTKVGPEILCRFWRVRIALMR